MKRLLRHLFEIITLGSFLAVGTAHSQTSVSTSSTRFVVRDERATGAIREERVAPPVFIPDDEILPGPVMPTPPPLPTRKPKPAPAPQAPDQKSFEFGRRTVLAHGPAVVWNGCARNSLIKGGKGTNSGCDEDYMHPKMADHMEKYFFKCAVDSADRAGIARPARIHLNHAGCYQNRNVAGSGHLSLHALARAIDIYNINLYDSQGKLTRISANVSQYRGTNKKFYDAFRRCWQRNLPSRCKSGGRESSGSIGIPGSEMGGNSAHADHLHLTFPPCGG